jgi:16S rRNA processing protein RimM
LTGFTGGSAPSPGDYLAVARVVGAHGIRGEVRCELITDFPERLKRARQLLIGEGHAPIGLERARLDRHGAILKLEGVDSRDDAERLRGQVLSVPGAEAVQLPGGTYFWHQIIGLRVRSDEGEDLGLVAEIIPTGGNDVYVVREDGREILLPAIKDVVREIDLAGGIMTVHMIEGLR